MGCVSSLQEELERQEVFDIEPPTSENQFLRSFPHHQHVQWPNAE